MNLSFLNTIGSVITILSSLGASYIWFKIWKSTKGGSSAWLILTIIAFSFTITTIYSAIVRQFSLVSPDINVIVLTFFTACRVILLFFAGYLFYKKFNQQ